MIGEGRSLKNLQSRFPIFFALLFIIFAIIFSRIFYLQVIKGSSYRYISNKNSLKVERVTAPRGQIYDRNGNILVDNRLQLDVTITRQYLRNPEKVLQKLSQLSNIKLEDLLKQYEKEKRQKRQFTPMSIIKDAPWETIAKIEGLKKELPGVAIVKRIKRIYIHNDVGSHVFGYLNQVNKKETSLLKGRGLKYHPDDFIGRYGIEKKWENELRGNDGIDYVIVDAFGRKILPENIDTNIMKLVGERFQPDAGYNLTLTIDQRLQYAIAESMGKDRLGATVAINVKSGEILAMHSQPSFDPNLIIAGRSKEWGKVVTKPFGPLRNKVIQDHFPPGSTFKIFTGLAGLEEKLARPKRLIYCDGTHKFGNRTYRCHKREGHGWVNMRQAIQKSCNIYFYKIAEEMKSVDPIYDVATRYGLGQKTEISLLNEAPGLIPNEEYKLNRFGKKWQTGETLSVAIGQSYTLVTPIQLAVSYGALLSGGTFYKPHLIKKVADSDGNLIKEQTPYIVRERKINEEHLKVIRGGLHDVVNKKGGTGYYTVRSDKIDIGGKSGTVQVSLRKNNDIFIPCKKLPLEKRHHAWFVGFAPVQDPEIVVASLAIHGCGGSSVAGPVVKSVIEKWVDIKKQEQEEKLFSIYESN